MPVLITLALALALLGAPPPASADPPTLRIDSCGAWKHPATPKSVYLNIGSVSAAWGTAFVTAARDWSAVSLGAWNVQTTSSGGNVTVVVDTSIGQWGFAGQWLDNAPCGTGHWTSGTIKINPSHPSADGALEQVAVACHELAHGLGAGHGGDGCVGSGYAGEGDVGFRYAPGTDTPALLRQRYAQAH